MNGKDLLWGMSHIEEKYIADAQKAKIKKVHRPGKFLLIAAIISVLGFTAFAIHTIPDNGEWFISFFAGPTHLEAQEELSDQQMEILDEGLVPINQTAAVAGYTLTLESGLSDGYRMLLKFNLTAPDGVTLDGRDYALCTEIMRMAPDGTADDYGTGTIFMEMLDDGNTDDNTVTFLLDHQIIPRSTGDYNLTDGGICVIRFYDIQEIKGYLEEYECTTLCEGSWNFEIQFRDDLLVTQSVQILDQPIRSGSHMWIDNFIFRNKEIPMKAKVISMEIRALTATVKVQRPLIARFAGVTLDNPIYVILEDGTRILAKQEMTAYCYDGTDNTLLTFEKPAPIQDVAWVEFSNGVKVQVSEERGG